MSRFAVSFGWRRHRLTDVQMCRSAAVPNVCCSHCARQKVLTGGISRWDGQQRPTEGKSWLKGRDEACLLLPRLAVLIVDRDGGPVRTAVNNAQQRDRRGNLALAHWLTGSRAHWHSDTGLIQGRAEGGNLWGWCMHDDRGLDGQTSHPTALAFSLYSLSLSYPGPLLQTSDEHPDCTFLATSIASLSQLARWLPSQASLNTTFNCGCCAPFPTSPSFRLARHLPSTSALCRAAIPPCSVPSALSRLHRAFIPAWLAVLARAPTPASPKCITSCTGSASGSEKPHMYPHCLFL